MDMVWTTQSGTRIELIKTGNFLLDGGTMFGRIPKTIWKQWFPADDQNRIVMAANILKVVMGDKTCLIDAGLGNLYDEREQDLLEIRPEKIDIGPIDYLICTHLHFDHIGGIHGLDIREGVLAAKSEWEDAHKADPLTKGSYRQIDLAAMTPKLMLIEPPFDLSGHIRIIPSPGHTQGHISVIIDDTFFYPGDLIPTAAHCHLPCIMAYDLYPLTIVDTKRRLLTMAKERGWITLFEHDPYHPCGSIAYSHNRFKALH